MDGWQEGVLGVLSKGSLTVSINCVHFPGVVAVLAGQEARTDEKLVDYGEMSFAAGKIPVLSSSLWPSRGVLPRMQDGWEEGGTAVVVPL